MYSIKELKKLLKQEVPKASNVFIVGHKNPDFDSIGSAIGLDELINHLGKKAYIVVDDDPSHIQDRIKDIIGCCKESCRFITKKDYLEKADNKSLLFVMDANKKDVISLGDCLDRVGKVIIIDHHEENQNTIVTPYKFIDNDASSASEMVTKLFEEMGLPCRSVANYLLSGISLDSNRFSYVGSNTFNAADYLISNGANMEVVNSFFQMDFTSSCNIYNLIVNGHELMKAADGNIVFCLNRESPLTEYPLEHLAITSSNLASKIDVIASFVLGYIGENVVRISARSSKYDVGSIMQSLGGGGSLHAAAATIVTEGMPEDIFLIEESLREKVLQKIK